MGDATTKLVWRQSETSTQLSGGDCGICLLMWSKGRRHPDSERQVLFLLCVDAHCWLDWVGGICRQGMHAISHVLTSSLDLSL